MQRIINFIIDNRISFLYGVLMLFSLSLTFRSHSYHHSKFFNSSKWLTGNVYNISNNITTYFNLKQVNENLVEENQRLRMLLFNQSQENIPEVDIANLNFEVIPGKIINNNFSSPRNYLTINRGESHGLKEDMGVITSIGILGIVENTSAKFATVQSILNTKSSINAKIKNTNYFGSLTWDARDYETVQLVDVPRSVPIVVGDTIITGGMSSIFPEGIPIGIVKKYELNQSQSFFDIQVELFNDMANLSTVYALKNFERKEQLNLEKATIDAQ